MRTLDTLTTQALAGSRSGDSLTVWVWYNGTLAYPDPLPIGKWELSYDTTRQTQTLTINVEDADGTKAPWLLDDPLGVGGSLLQVYYNVGGAGSVAYDWFRISETDPIEAWRTYRVTDQGIVNVDSPLGNGVIQKWASGGADITVKAETLVRNILNYQFLAPSSPPTTGSPTAVSEIKRLCADIMPVTALSGVVDQAVPANLVYPNDRLNAVQSLAQRIGCDIRTNGSGVLEIYPLAYSSSVWTLQPGPEGFLIDVQRTMKLDGAYNVFVADGTAGQNPIRGVAKITGGPLRAGGPHGTYPVFYSSNSLTTQAQADAYAATMRDTQLRGLTIAIVVDCLPHPGLQQGDWITVVCPNASTNGTFTFPARIRTIDLKGHDATVDAMQLTLDATYGDVAAAFSGVPLASTKLNTLYPEPGLYPGANVYPEH